MRRFTALSAGMLVSLLGSAFTSLALAVWVFDDTGSVTWYAVTLIVNFLPGILFAPLAGALVDRWRRRTILIVSDALHAMTVLVLAVLYAAGGLELWHIFVTVGVQSLLRALQVPAMSSVVVLLAPAEQVGRANGMILLAQAIGNTMGFAAGGVLLAAIGLSGVLVVDGVTFAVNLVILLLVKIPDPPRSAAGAEAAGTLRSEIWQGWKYLSARRVLVALVVFYAALNVSVGYVDALLTPMVLSFASAQALGVVIASLGVGMLAGGAVLTVWGGPRRRIDGLAGFALPLGLFLCLGAVRPNIPMIMIAAFSFMFCFTIIEGTTRSVLQLEVEPDMQGRAFATLSMVTNAALCSSYALAGPITDHWVEPLMREGGPFAGSVGALIGVGPGRGMALLVLALGLLMILTAVLAYAHPDLRSLPDRPSAGGDAAEPAAAAAPVAPVEDTSARVSRRQEDSAVARR
jgi:MFS family permease